jgi:hypothetical protein
MKVQPGRFTAQIDGDFVVFIIGMRINKLWKVHKWLPVARAMGPMLSTLFAHPEKGMLGASSSVSGRTVTLIQYWRSFDDLERFAKDRDDPHLEPWRRFNQRVGSSGDVGVFHETYRVGAGSYESIYANMPVMGLAKATSHVPVERKGDTARRRLTGDQTMTSTA